MHSQTSRWATTGATVMFWHCGWRQDIVPLFRTKTEKKTFFPFPHPLRIERFTLGGGRFEKMERTQEYCTSKWYSSTLARAKGNTDFLVRERSKFTSLQITNSMKLLLPKFLISNQKICKKVQNHTAITKKAWRRDQGKLNQSINQFLTQ